MRFEIGEAVVYHKPMQNGFFAEHHCVVGKMKLSPIPGKSTFRAEYTLMSGKNTFLGVTDKDIIKFAPNKQDLKAGQVVIRWKDFFIDRDHRILWTPEALSYE